MTMGSGKWWRNWRSEYDRICILKPKLEKISAIVETKRKKWS